MLKRRPKYLPVAAVLALVLGAAWLSDHLNGSSLDEGDGSRFVIGMSRPHKGDEVYYLAPILINKSRQSLELKSVVPDRTQPGLQFLEARVYPKPDRMDGPHLSWSTGEPDRLAPPKLQSEPVGGQKIAAESTFDRIIYLRYRVTSDQRPLRSSDVKVTYHRGFRDHTQILPTTFEVIEPQGQ